MNDDPLVALRRDYHFARALQFLLLFYPVLPDILPDSAPLSPATFVVRLEWLLAFETDPDRLAVPFFALLRCFNPRAAKSPDSLLKEYVRRGKEFRYFDGFLELTVQERARLLNDLCDFLSENAEIFRSTFLNGFNEQHQYRWRIEPLGSDSTGFVYYVFDDGRLYREKRDLWELIAASKTEWAQFIKNGLSRRPADKRLIDFLKTDMLPELADLHDELEREEQKLRRLTEVQSLPRKRSSRLEAMKEQQAAEAAAKEVALFEAKLAQKRQREESFSVAKTAIYSPPKKTRADRLKERELKKVLLAVADSEQSDEVGEEEEEEQFVYSHVSQTPPSSPLKLTLRRPKPQPDMGTGGQVNDVRSTIVDVEPSRRQDERTVLVASGTPEKITEGATDNGAVDSRDCGDLNVEDTEEAKIVDERKRPLGIDDDSVLASADILLEFAQTVTGSTGVNQ